MKILLLLLVFSWNAWAQDFPDKGPLEITVLFAAGSSADVTARLLADGMSQHLGQRVLVVNRPGAGGAIGYKYVASQKADGYALVWNSNSISTTYHSGQLAFDYKAFDAVARVLSESVVLAVRADAKWKNLNDLVNEAKAKPKIVSVGHSGIGSHTHISLVALFSAAGVEVNEVPSARRRWCRACSAATSTRWCSSPARSPRRSSRVRRGYSRRSRRRATRHGRKYRPPASRDSTRPSTLGAASRCRTGHPAKPS
jgi:hypothetical protein